jgi:hypothetical protein
LLLATLDYLQQHLGGSFVCDQNDVVSEYYQQQKVQTEKYFKQRRLDRMQQRLASLSKGLQNRTDLNFASYIKEKTGYDIDIFEDLRKRVAAIIAQNEIRSQKELNDISKMLHYFHRTSDTGEEVEDLNALISNYSQQANRNSRKGKGRFSEIIRKTVKDGIEKTSTIFSNGPKPKHFEQQETTSPDGKRTVRVTQWSDGKHASTQVTLQFPTAGGAVYATSGIHPEVKAWWKNNSTIVIQTKKEYEADEQVKQVRSFDDVISIEYVEP